MTVQDSVLEAIPVPVKITGDIVSAGVVVSAFINALPSFAAVLSIIWLVWQMVDRIRYGPRVKRKNSKPMPGEIE